MNKYFVAEIFWGE